MKETRNIRPIINFYNEEYKQQAQNKNFQSISSAISGVKPTANKALFTVLDDNITSFQKVEVVSNATALKTEYLGGSSNIDGVIVNVAITYTGSNNLGLLDTDGDFGARLDNTSAASRYIKIRKSKNFDMLFNKEDINILPRYNLEGKDIEYQFLTFNLPMILINSQEGMGSGHAQKILGRNPEEVRDILIKKLKGKKTEFNLKPYFKGFQGIVENGENNKQWIIKGVIEETGTYKTKIIEVPISESYKSMIKKLDKLVESKVINSYEDLCDPKTDKFLFTLKHDNKFGALKYEEKLDKLKLIKTISENYTCIDANNKIKIFQSTDEIFNYYYDIRLQYIQKRKDFILNKLKYDISIAKSKQFYIIKCISDEIILKNKLKKEINDQISKCKEILKVQDSYNYLINMPMHSVSKDTVEELIQKVKELEIKFEELTNTSIEQMWLNDIKDLKF